MHDLQSNFLGEHAPNSCTYYSFATLGLSISWTEKSGDFPNEFPVRWLFLCIWLPFVADILYDKMALNLLIINFCLL